MIRTTNADGTVTRSVVIESTDDDEDSADQMHGLPLSYLEEAVSDAPSSEDEQDVDDLQELLKPHGLQWKRVAHVATDEPDKRQAQCRIKFTDGIGCERTPLQYYMALYPMDHVDETIEATNAKLDILGHRHMTV